MDSSLQKRIEEDFGVAMKEGGIRLDTIRLLKSVLHNREIEKKGKGDKTILSEEETLEVVMKEAKKRKEAAELYIKGGRAELAKREQDELKILEAYLPPQVSEEETRAVVVRAIQVTGAKTAKEFGFVMKEVMKELKGKADSSLITKIIKEILDTSSA